MKQVLSIGLVALLLAGAYFLGCRITSARAPAPQSEAPPAAPAPDPVLKPGPAPFAPDEEDPTPTPTPAPAPDSDPDPGEAEGLAKRLVETRLEGTGTGDFAIVKVAFRDHGFTQNYIEREIEVTYRNWSELTRAFHVKGFGTHKHTLFLPPNRDEDEKVARGRMSLKISGPGKPPFEGEGSGFTAVWP